FSSLADLRARFGPAGVREFIVDYPDGAPVRGAVTDDTQMTLWTVEGLIRAADGGAVGVVDNELPDPGRSEPRPEVGEGGEL
ncbi:ADP-ribosylglycohydrolase family protein, partial [Marinitenerispora sediminis]|uniref:ADP-ribosylglycohydrolase family protein n=1 Tax=Marinitenerispora sediminis TaxID=1931232 RepID=UPI000DF92371